MSAPGGLNSNSLSYFDRPTLRRQNASDLSSLPSSSSSSSSSSLSASSSSCLRGSQHSAGDSGHGVVVGVAPLLEQVSEAVADIDAVLGDIEAGSAFEDHHLDSLNELVESLAGVLETLNLKCIQQAEQTVRYTGSTAAPPVADGLESVDECTRVSS